MNPIPFRATAAVRATPRPAGPTLAVEVTPLSVRLVMAGGDTAHALVFLHTSSDRRPGPQSLGERLCDANTSFLPCVVDRGVELINLEHVACVQAPLDLPDVEELEELPSFRAAVDLDLVHGERLSGELRYRLPPESCRISDLFNDDAERFVLLTTDRRAVYVNRRAVVRVRVPAEDSSCR
jgi:hypothetical protein